MHFLINCKVLPLGLCLLSRKTCISISIKLKHNFSCTCTTQNAAKNTKSVSSFFSKYFQCIISKGNIILECISTESDIKDIKMLRGFPRARSTSPPLSQAAGITIDKHILCFSFPSDIFHIPFMTAR